MSKIKLIREYGGFDSIEFSFRYIQLTEDQKEFIENELKATDINLESRLSEGNGFVLAIEINESINPEIFRKLNEQLIINENKFGIWVSFTTNYDIGGFSFPKYVVDFIRIVGGNVDVSTIMIDED